MYSGLNQQALNNSESFPAESQSFENETSFWTTDSGIDSISETAIKIILTFLPL